MLHQPLHGHLSPVAVAIHDNLVFGVLVDGDEGGVDGGVNGSHSTWCPKWQVADWDAGIALADGASKRVLEGIPVLD